MLQKRYGYTIAVIFLKFFKISVIIYIEKLRKEQIKMDKFDKRVNKKTGEELQMYLAFRRKAGRVPSKKGKGSYDRKTFKKEVA